MLATRSTSIHARARRFPKFMTVAPRNLFVTQNYPPESGGMSRRHAELVRRYVEPIEVSTVAHDAAAEVDASGPNVVHRQPFPARAAKLFGNEVRWGRWLASYCRSGVEVMHCGEIRPVGYAVWWASKRSGVPYVVYVNGGDLLRERQKTARHWSKRVSAFRLLGDAAGIVANSAWTATLARDIMAELHISAAPPVAAIDLGTDPRQFSPARETGKLRARLDAGVDPILLTVARLVPHKGQDTTIRMLAQLRQSHPDVRYVVVGSGSDRERLVALAGSLGVGDRVHFVGQLNDVDLADAYATATAYVGMSRLDSAINVEGFGISFVEASASGAPVIAGDSGGVRSAVRDGHTGFVVPAEDVGAAAAAAARILDDRELQERMGASGRTLVESHYNWDRVAVETRSFVEQCLDLRTPRD